MKKSIHILNFAIYDEYKDSKMVKSKLKLNNIPDLKKYIFEKMPLPSEIILFFDDLQCSTSATWDQNFDLKYLIYSWHVK